MDAKDLRIGNWVKIKDSFFNEHYDLTYSHYTTNEFQITGWNDGSDVEGCKQIAFYSIPEKLMNGKIHSGIWDNCIEPIPLTEEHLFKFGFDKLANDIPTYYKCFGNLIEDDYEFSFNIYVDSEQNYFITVFGRKIIIKYIHQLQNLYFFISDEELTIK
jgi:hypothetical protein